MFDFNYYESDPSKLLSFVDELAIWSEIMEKPLEIGVSFTNSLRMDNNPGCFISPSRKDGRLLLFDYADSRFNYSDIIQGLRLKYNITFSEAIDIINQKKFISKEKIQVKKKLYRSKAKESVRVDLYIHPTSFKKEHKDYCKKLRITAAQLQEDGTTATKYVRKIKGTQQSIIYLDKLSFVLTFPSKHVKIYQPDNKKFKWISNIDKNDLGQYEKLTDKKTVIISKGYFDCRLLRNEGFNSFWTQNESMLLSDEIIWDLYNRYDDVVFFYDNDEAGIKGAIKNAIRANSITNSSKFINTNLPTSFLELGITDNKDLVLKKSYDEYKNIIHGLFQI